MISIDKDKQTIAIDEASEVSLFSPEGFKIISDLWLEVGWDQKYMYGFTWLGRPIIQLPDDMIRVQEVIYDVKPDLVIETGIAHGGSLIYYASILNAIGHGRVLGIDIEIRAHNRTEITGHRMYELIDLIEGSSIAEETVSKVEEFVDRDMTILIILDSDHSYEHVYKELCLYSKYVSSGSYIVVTDGSFENYEHLPRAKLDYPEMYNSWNSNNPKKAAKDFVDANGGFLIVEPEFPFNEGAIPFRVTHCPSAFIKKL